VTDIRLTGVSKNYGRHRVLDAVTLQAGPGVLGMLGPNGAGKTTLLRILATVAGPSAGRVELLGRDIADPALRTEVRRKLGYVPQETGFPSGFTAFEYLDYVGILKEMPDRRARHDEVRRVLDVVGLSPMARRRIRRLSGGMKQRLVIAQALLGDPRLLVLDEPTVGLDVPARRGIVEHVHELCRNQGMAVLWATHLIDEVHADDRVVVIHKGRILADGSVAEVNQHNSSANLTQTFHRLINQVAA
jgi:ABC-2 type transport system ATP-binding protein